MRADGLRTPEEALGGVHGRELAPGALLQALRTLQVAWTVNPHPQLYRTTYASPQLELWELDDAQWRKVVERPPYAQRCAQAPETPFQQLALPMVGLAVALLLAILG
jgi:hypothetical protein